MRRGEKLSSTAVVEGEEPFVDEALALVEIVGHLDIVPCLTEKPVDVKLKFRGLVARLFHLEEKGPTAGDPDEQVRPAVLAHRVQLGDLESETPCELDHFLLVRGLAEVSHPESLPMAIW